MIIFSFYCLNMLMDLMYTVRFDPEEFVSDFSEAVEIQPKYFCYISIII